MGSLLQPRAALLVLAWATRKLLIDMLLPQHCMPGLQHFPCTHMY